MLHDELERYRRERSEAALVALLLRAQSIAHSVAARVSKDDADDVGQEVLLELLDRLPRFRDGRHCARWTQRAALHRAIDGVRSRRRRMRRERERARPEATEGLDATRLSDDEQLALHECLLELPAGQRSLLLGRYFEQRTLDHLARELGCSINAVWKRLEQSKGALAKRMRRKGWGAAAVGPFLDALPPVEPPAHLPGVVLDRVRDALTVGSPTVIGGWIMAKKLVAAALLVAALVGVGVGVKQWGERTPGEESSSIARGEGVTGGSQGGGRAVAERPALKQGASGETPGAPGVADLEQERPLGSPPLDDQEERESPLFGELQEFERWIDQRNRDLERFRVVMRDDPGSAFDRVRELEEETQRRILELRTLVYEDPETYLDYLRALDDSRMLNAFLRILEDRDSSGIGSYAVAIQEYSALPAALGAGLLDLLRDGDARHQEAVLDVLGSFRKLPTEYEPVIRRAVGHPDDRVVSRALHAWASAGWTSDDARFRDHLLNLIDRTEDVGLVNSAVHALTQLDDPVVARELLKHLETGRLDQHFGLVSPYLRVHVARGDAADRASLVRSLGVAFERRPVANHFEQLASLACALESDSATRALTIARDHAPTPAHAKALTTAIERIAAGGIVGVRQSVLFP